MNHAVKSVPEPYGMDREYTYYLEVNMNRTRTFARIVSAFLALVMVLGAFASFDGVFSRAKAEIVNPDGSIVYGYDGKDVVLNKDAWLAADGTYCIDLTAYTTGQTLLTEQHNEAPTDFLFVIDQSCNMVDSWSSGCYTVTTYARSAIHSITRGLVNELRSGTHANTDHRVAIIGFGGYDCYAGETNTGLFDTNGNWYNYHFERTQEYPVSAQDKYNDALIHVNTTAGLTAINKALGSLRFSSGAVTFAGLDMALGIIQASANDTYTAIDENGNVLNVPRKKVVILITDGTPGWDGFDMNIAAASVSGATEVKRTALGLTEQYASVLGAGSDLNTRIFTVALSSELEQFNCTYEWANYNNSTYNYFGSNYPENDHAVPINENAYNPAYGNDNGVFTYNKYNTLNLQGEFYSRDYTTLLSSAYPATESYGPNGPITGKYLTNAKAYSYVGQNSSGASSYNRTPVYKINGSYANTTVSRQGTIGYFYNEANGSYKLISGVYDNNVRNFNNRIAYNYHPVDKANDPVYGKYYMSVPDAATIINGTNYSQYTPKLRAMLETMTAEIPTIRSYNGATQMETIGEAYIKDIISEYFVYHSSFDTNTNVKTFTQDAIGYQNGEYVFANSIVPYNGAVVNFDGNDVVTVGGFDYDANTCYRDSNGVHGKKFIVQIRGLLAKPSTIGTVPVSNTPGNTSGLYSGTPDLGSTTPVLPTVTYASLQNMTVKPGSSKIPTFSVQPANANYTVVWTSSNTNVATVDANSGKVTGQNPGTSTLTARITDNVNGQVTTWNATITVPQPTTGNNGGSSPISQIASIPEIKLIKGSSQLPVINVIPANADYSVSYSLTNPNVATFNEDGLLTGLNDWTSGNITITITDNVTGQPYPRTVKITTYPASSAVNVSTVDLNNMTVVAGSSKTPVLNVTGTEPTYPTNYSTTWTIGDPTIATVNANGKVTGIKNGTTTLTATVYDKKAGTTKSATANVTVVGGVVDTTTPITGVSVDPLTVVKGSAKLPNFYVGPNDADYTVTWTSSNNSVARIDPDTGMVTGVKAGTATITATVVDKANNNPWTVNTTVTVVDENNNNNGGSTNNDQIIVLNGDEVVFPVPSVKLREKQIVYDFSLVIKDDDAISFFDDTKHDENDPHDVAHILGLDDAFAKQTMLSNGSYNYHTNYPYDTVKHADVFEKIDVSVTENHPNGVYTDTDSHCHAQITIKSINGDQIDLAALLQLNTKRVDIITGEEVIENEWCKISIIPATNVHYEESLMYYNGAQTKGKGVSDSQWIVLGQPNGATYEVSSTGNGSLLGGSKYGDSHQSTENTVYGHDAEYHNLYENGKERETHGDSNGRAMGVKVDAALLALVNAKQASWPTVTFTFQGTGLDIISRTGDDTGVLSMDLVPVGKSYSYNNAVDSRHITANTYYGDGLLYQIPVIHVEDLPFGEYKVRIIARYDPDFDQMLKGYTPTKNSYEINQPGLEPNVAYEIVNACDGIDSVFASTGTKGGTKGTAGTFNAVIDSIRVYNPHVENLSHLSDAELVEHPYYEAFEQDPDYVQVRSILIDPNNASFGNPADRVNGIVYIDGSTGEQIAIEDYILYGPKNEAYLKPGNGFAFTVKDFLPGDELHISAKAPNAQKAVMTVNGNKYSVDSATELYFNVTDAIRADGRVVIGCDDPGNNLDAIVSICHIKLVSKSGVNPSVNTRGIASRLYVDSATLENASDHVNTGNTTLTAPKTIRVTLSNKKPFISWTKVNGAHEYEIWRKVEGGEFELAAVTNALAYTDLDQLAPLTKYYYKVNARDAYGVVGPDSNTVSVTTYGIKAPAGVKGVITATKPVITWKASVGAEYYEVYRSTEKDGEYTLIGTTEALTYTDNDELVSFQKYFYKVVAHANDGAYSPFSTPATVTAYGIKAPTSVKGVITATKPVITWKAAANATRYDIYRSNLIDGEYIMVGTTDTLSFTDEDELVPFQKYFYKVVAKDNYGFESPLSTHAIVTAYGIKAPAGVKGVITATKPVITWKAAVNATKYDVYRSIDKEGGYEFIATVNGLTFTDNEQLVPFQKYYYKVVAKDNYGFESPFSAAATIIAYGIKAPTGVKAVLADGKITVTWKAAVNATSYRVYRSTSATEGFTLVGTVTGLSFTDNGQLTTGQRYYYKLIAQDNYGFESPFSTAGNVIYR